MSRSQNVNFDERHSQGQQFGAPQPVDGRIRTIKDEGMVSESVDREKESMPNSVINDGEVRTGIIFGDDHKQEDRSRDERSRKLRETDIKTGQTQVERENRTQLMYKPKSLIDKVFTSEKTKQNPVQSPKDQPIIDKKDNPLSDRNRNEPTTDRRDEKDPRNQQTKNREDILTQGTKSFKDLDRDSQDSDNDRDKRKTRGEKDEKMDNSSKDNKSRNPVVQSYCPTDKDRQNVDSNKDRQNQQKNNNQSNTQSSSQNTKGLFQAQRREDDRNDTAYDSDKMKTDSQKQKEKTRKQNSTEEIKNEAETTNVQSQTNQGSNQWADQRSGQKKDRPSDTHTTKGNSTLKKMSRSFGVSSGPNYDKPSVEEQNLNPDQHKNQTSVKDNEKTRLEKDIEEENKKDSIAGKVIDMYEGAKEKIKETLHISTDKDDQASSLANQDKVIDVSSQSILKGTNRVDESPLQNSADDKSKHIENVKDQDRQGREALNYTENKKNKSIDDVLNKEARMDNPSRSGNILERESSIFDRANTTPSLKNKADESINYDDPADIPYQKYDVNERNVQEMIENDKDNLYEVGKSGDIGFKAIPSAVENMGVTHSGRDDKRMGKTISKKISYIMHGKSL